MKKRGKKAQFYLIAAAIIIIAIAGVYATYNYVINKPQVFYDFSSELKREGASVIDYGVWVGIDPKTVMRNFTESYFSSYAEEKDTTELVYIYGDLTSSYISTYKMGSVGAVCLGADVGCINTIQGQVGTRSAATSGGKVIVELQGESYEFSLSSGQNFYFVIKQEIEDENRIITG